MTKRRKHYVEYEKSQEDKVPGEANHKTKHERHKEHEKYINRETEPLEKKKNK